MVSSNPNYDHYSADMVGRLDGFYGRVDTRMNEKVTQWVSGEKVLDIGCGFGQLVEYLRIKGYDATGIDMLPEFIKVGKRRFPNAHLLSMEFDDLVSTGNLFDTVILKDTLHHIWDESDVSRFLQQVKEVCCQRILILDPNPTLLLRLARWIIKHKDPFCSPEEAKKSLSEAGFVLVYEDYAEFLAFPLSGGFIGKEMIGNYAIGSIILTLDRIIVKFLRTISLSKIFCWRYLLVADVQDSLRKQV